MATPVSTTCLTVGGDLWHTIRFPTFWQTFVDVKRQGAAGNPGFCADSACAAVDDDLHVCVIVGPSGTMFHTIRLADPLSWQPFGDVSAAASGFPGPLADVACAAIDGDLHVCVVTQSGGLFYTIRFAAPPSWQPFGDVSMVAPAFPGPLADVACAAIDGDLHVCVVTVSGRLFHTIRSANPPSWQPFADVGNQGAGTLPRPLTSVACAASAGELHICCLDEAVPGRSPSGELLAWNGGDLFHTIRFKPPPPENPECDQIRDEISQREAGIENRRGVLINLNIRDPVDRLEIMSLNKEIQGHEEEIRVFQQRLNELGCRTPSPLWQRFGDVKRQGAAGDPGPLEDVGCATVNGDLHVCATTKIQRTNLTGDLWHTIRFAAAPSWQPFGDVLGAAGTPWPPGAVLGRVSVSSLLAEPPGAPPPENPECNDIRGAIGERQGEIDRLQAEVVLLNIRDPVDRIEIESIRTQIDTLQGEVRDLEQRSVLLGCRG